MSSLDFKSMPTVGSSNNNKRGCWIRAIARLSLRFIPPDKVCTGSSQAVSAILSQILRSCIVSCCCQLKRSKNCIFSFTDKSSHSANCCGTNPICLRNSALAVCPSKLTTPLSACKRVAKICRSVDFPAPFLPTNPTISPSVSVNETLSSTHFCL